eukprot:TRINITY_DN28926_c2_g1_i1.p1 TRINITY_DN28926_c2_g1~~TRINITY_DN28926_c2_g1_i1.p1  ORF type:complete len:475 (+),score=70.89 TRINITY_DN28926_c2_g1_i1:53-1477(+)
MVMLEESKVHSDEELLAHYSVKTTSGSDELAQLSLKKLGEAVDHGKLVLADNNLTEESCAKVLKVVGIMAKLKGMLETRSSTLPIKEFDLSGIRLLNVTPEDSNLTMRWDAKRRAQTVQIVVQFVRVSTDAKIVKLEDCGLQGDTHNKDDLIEQEIIRLVKKFGFGAGKDAKFATEVSLAGNKFTAEFASKVISAAFWERERHPDKPKLHLNLRRNRIRGGDKIIQELRAGQSAGGVVSVASADDSIEEREKALIVVDLGDQVEGSGSSPAPARAAQPSGRAPARPPLQQRSQRSPSRRRRSRSRSASQRRRSRSSRRSPFRSRSRSRSRSRGRGGKNGRSRSRSASKQRGGRRRRRRQTRGGGGGRRRKRQGGGGGRQRRGRDRRRERTRSPSRDEYDSEDSRDDGYSASRSRSRSAEGREAGGKRRDKSRSESESQKREKAKTTRKGSRDSSASASESEKRDSKSGRKSGRR